MKGSVSDWAIQNNIGLYIPHIQGFALPVQNARLSSTPFKLY